MYLQAMLFNLYGVGTPQFVYMHGLSLLHAIICKHVHYARMQTDKVTRDHLKNILEEEVKDNEIKKVHQGLHLKLNNLVKKTQYWHMECCCIKIPTSTIIITGC